MFLGFLSASERSRRNLASAFIGEIVAAMGSVEDNAKIRRLSLQPFGSNELPVDFSDFQLPKLTVYEANAGRLGVFNAPLPREIAYFYTRFAALPDRLRALTAPSPASIEDMRRKTQEALDDVSQTLQLGEDLLRSIKPFVSRRQPESISRA